MLYKILGIVAVLFYCIHGAYWIYKGVPSSLMWGCHIASLLIGFGMFFEMPRVNAIGVLWLVPGNFFWVMYLLNNGDFEPTSPLTHIGGITIGLIGIYRMGFPTYSWFWALMGVIALQIVTLFVTPAKDNINMVFRTQDGFEQYFPSHFWFEMMVLADSLVSFYFAELIIRRIR